MHPFRANSLPGVVLVMLASSGMLPAQPTAPGTVAGTGTFDIKRQPETLRVQIEVLTRGKTFKEALEKLKVRREEVRNSLVQLGAKKDAIVIGDPTSADELSGRQADVNRFLRDRNQALGKQDTKVDPPAIVSAMVRVEFPLPTGGSDESLLAAHALQEKIKAASLGGLRDKGKLTPEEQEAIDEAVGRSRPGEGGEARGEPAFLFVCKITEDERAKALTGAFAKAKRDAERLARAAGAELGGLQRLTNPLQPTDLEDIYYPGRRGYGYSPSIRSVEGEDGLMEAVGLQPGKVTFRAGILAEFTLKPATQK